MTRSKAFCWLGVILVVVSFNLCNCRSKLKETTEPAVSSDMRDNAKPSDDLAEEEIPQPNHPNIWEIDLAEKESFSTAIKFNYVLGKVENRKVKVVEKNSWDYLEKVLLDYDNYAQSNYLLTLSISPNGQFLAYYGKDGLVVFDRKKHTETVLEKTFLNDGFSKKYSPTIRNIQWSSDGAFLLLQYLANEATAVFVYDINQKKKLTPAGDGLLSGTNMLWAPNMNVFLDPSSDNAYGDPGLYQSDVMNIGLYSDISTLIGFQNGLFYKASYHPDGHKIAFLTSFKENQFFYSPRRTVCLFNQLDKKVIEIDHGLFIDTLFFSPDGKRLYYFTREEGSSQQTIIMSYDLTLQDSKIEGFFLTNAIDIREAKWIDEHVVLLEILHWNKDHSFKNTQIVGLDFSQKMLLYTSQPCPFEIKILAVPPYTDFMKND